MSKQKKLYTRRPWTPEEDARILLGIAPMKLAKEFKRTVPSVQSRKNVLKNNPPTSSYKAPEVKMAAKQATQEISDRVEDLLEEADAEADFMDDYMGLSINGGIIFVERDRVEMINVEGSVLQVHFKD